MQGGRLTQSDAQRAVDHIEHCPMEHPGEDKGQELQGRVEHAAASRDVPGMYTGRTWQKNGITLGRGCRAGPGG